MSVLISCKQNGQSMDKMKKSNASISSEKEISNILDTATYMLIGDPDTALVIFMYNNIANYNFDTQREEYIRWDLEKMSLLPLLLSLYGNEKDFQQKLQLLEINQNIFLQEARAAVKADYKEFASITDMMEFDYLLQKQDSCLKLILEKMVSNTLVEKDERAKVQEILNSW